MLKLVSHIIQEFRLIYRKFNNYTVFFFLKIDYDWLTIYKKITRSLFKRNRFYFYTDIENP